VAQPKEDMVLKAVIELFKGDAVKFFGIDKQIVSAVTISAESRTELSHIHIQKNVDDWLLEADDGSFIHFEFQSDYDPQDLKRFMVSDAMLYFKVGKPIRTVVVYTAEIQKTQTRLDAGAIQYEVDAFYMSAMDGDAVYDEIRAKLASGAALSKQDLMGIVFIPMMKSNVDRIGKFERAFGLSHNIEDKDAKPQIQAMLQLLAEKFVKNPNIIKKLKELVNMTIFQRMALEEGEQKGRQEATFEIVKKMLETGLEIEIITKTTGLNESDIEKMLAAAQ